VTLQKYNPSRQTTLLKYNKNLLKVDGIWQK